MLCIGQAKTIDLNLNKSVLSCFNFIKNYVLIFCQDRKRSMVSKHYVNHHHLVISIFLNMLSPILCRSSLIPKNSHFTNKMNQLGKMWKVH